MLSHLSQSISKTMGCCSHTTRSSSPPPKQTKLKPQILLQIPNARVHLAINPESSIELSHGDFSVFHSTENNLPLATVIKVGDLNWPLTKDEPVIRVSKLHYLFTVQDEEFHFLNYGVSFAAANENQLVFLDQFLKQNSCFSSTYSAHSPSSAKTNDFSWKDYAPNIEDYNGVLAKAIALGTGEIVKGVFKLSNEYSNQVQKGATLIKPQDEEKKNGISVDGSIKNRGINNTLKRVRKLSEMTEKMSQNLLNGVVAMTGNVAAPFVRSKAGNFIFASAPGQVLLASMDALNKVVDAAEIAEKRAFEATSVAVTKAVSRRLGESAGEATDDVLATAGHAVGTAWNVFKIRKAINPKASFVSNIVGNAARKKY